ncbi:MAG: hypothetical protein BGO02_03820 [Brevundimonas sp. 67-6]|nr:MAG: hypothetical protein BGO02_03820 [Brevundimonas sp. 67-6]
MYFDMVARGREPMRDLFRGVFRRSTAREQLRLYVVQLDSPDIAKGFNNDRSHRSISSED